jgi:hypothetical protein
MPVLDSERVPECGLPDSIMRVLKAISEPIVSMDWSQEIEGADMTKMKSVQYVLDTYAWANVLTLAHEPSWKFIITTLDRVEKSFNPKRNKSYKQPLMRVLLHGNPFWRERSQQLIEVRYGHARGVLLCQVYNG